MFNFKMFKDDSWAELRFTARIKDNAGGVIGEQSFKHEGGKGGEWRTYSVPFDLPMGYNGSVTLEIEDDKSQEYVLYAIDDLSVALCGETMPKVRLGINGMSYQIYAESGTCLSDTIFVDVEVREKIELAAMADVSVCENTDVSLTGVVVSGAPTDFVWRDSENGSASLSSSSDLQIRGVLRPYTISLEANDGVCFW